MAVCIHGPAHLSRPPPRLSDPDRAAVLVSIFDGIAIRVSISFGHPLDIERALTATVRPAYSAPASDAPGGIERLGRGPGGDG